MYNLIFELYTSNEVDHAQPTLHEARADFSRLVDRALQGEPQRVVKRGKPAVLVISEEAWLGRKPGRPTLVGALKAFALAGGLDREE